MTISLYYNVKVIMLNCVNKYTIGVYMYNVSLLFITILSLLLDKGPKNNR